MDASATGPKGPVLLAGAGHAHLHLVDRAEELTASGAEVLLVSPGDFFYSGSATGVLAGLYPPGANRIDVAALAEARGVRFVRDRVVGADPRRRRVRLASGDTLRYRLLSVNIGSVTAGSVRGAEEHALPVKPVAGVRGLVTVLREAATEGVSLRVVVVGGGPSGCEVALAVRRRAEREGTAARVTVATLDEVLEGLPAGARRSMRGVLERRGVELLEGVRVEEVESDRVLLEDGRALPSDLTVDATGLLADPVVRRLGLAVGAGGGLRVDRYLCSVDDSRVFGAGDCVSFDERTLPKVGVFAVRQAPILLHNLRATLEDRPLTPFRPQSRYLLVLALGDGTGLAVRGRFHLTGRLAFRVKDWLDRRFLRRYRTSSSQHLFA